MAPRDDVTELGALAGPLHQTDADPEETGEWLGSVDGLVEAQRR